MTFRSLLAIVATLVFATLVSSCSTDKQQPASETRQLFRMTAPNFYPGPDLPKNLSTSDPNKLFEIIDPVDGKAFVIASFTLGGESGYPLTTMFVYTRDAAGMKGWNVVINRDGKGVTERKFISMANGKKADVVLSGALFLVATEVPVAATSEALSAEELDQHLKPTLDWLQSLL